MSTWTQEEQMAVAGKIMEKCASDPAFRATALADPAAAVNEVAGKPLPEGFNLRFVSNEGADFTMVLPDPVSEELSDADLESVAGGKGGVPPTVVIGVTIAAE